MAKKKSKTQKSKQNQKKKLNTAKTKQNTVETTTKKTTSKTNSTPKKNTSKKEQIKQPEKKEQPKQTKSKQVVDKKEVKYNVVLDAVKKEDKPKKEKQLVDKDKVKYNVVLAKTQENQSKSLPEKEATIKKDLKIKETLNKISTNTKEFFSKIKSKLKKNKPEEKKKYVKKDKKNKNKKVEEVKPKNIFLRALYELRKNFHILFNVALIITYIILLIGLIRSNAFTKGTIIYISCIVIFLTIVATSYTKYLSGKIFSIIIIAGMILGIYKIQYTYDFINNLNSNEYEYKTYYVVTFNNGQNKSIYNVNNKKVCLLKDNSKNIQRKLNTKLDSVIYVEHEDPNMLYSEFYNTNCRAIIVNENQYKYLTNNIEQNSRNIKILYEFKANGRK